MISIGGQRTVLFVFDEVVIDLDCYGCQIYSNMISRDGSYGFCQIDFPLSGFPLCGKAKKWRRVLLKPSPFANEHNHDKNAFCSVSKDEF